MDKEKRILITGFGPFRRHAVNPSGELAMRFHGRRIAGTGVTGRVVPVTWEACRECGDDIRREPPDAVVMTGLRTTHTRIGVERIAVNLMDSRHPDNDGVRWRDRRIDAAGVDGIFATLPVRAIHDALQADGFPVHVSNSAGTYVCNCLFYHVMRVAAARGIPAGFIHLPAPRGGWNMARLESALGTALTAVASRLRAGTGE